MSLKKTFIILSVIILLGAGLRFSGLGNNSFSSDEFLDMASSYGYFKTGVWQAWDFNHGQPSANVHEARDVRAWMYKWQTARLFSVLPPTEATARAVSALWGTLTVALMFLVGWLFSGRKLVGLFAAFLFAVSVSGIEFSRTFRMYAMFFPVFLLFSYTLFRFYEGEYGGKCRIVRRISERYGLDIRFLFPAALLGTLSLHIHLLTVNIVFIFGAYVLWRLFLDSRAKRPLRNKYGWTVATGIVGAVLAWLAVPGKLRPVLEGLTPFSDGTLEDHYSYFAYVAGDYAHPVLALLLLILGAWWLSRKLGKPKESAWLVASSLVPLLSAVFLWNRVAGDQYIYFAQSFEMLLIAVGGYAVVRFVRDRFEKDWKRVACAAILGFAILVPDWSYFLQENNTYHETSSSSAPNYRKIYQYFRQNHEPGEALIARDFRNYYWSGMGIPVENIGGEVTRDKLTLERLQEIMTEYPRGWVIVSDNDTDFISRDAERFIERNMEKQSHSLIRGNVSVWRWGIADSPAIE